MNKLLEKYFSESYLIFSKVAGFRASASEIIIIVFLLTFHKSIAEYSGGNFKLEKKFCFRMRKGTESFETYLLLLCIEEKVICI